MHQLKLLVLTASVLEEAGLLELVEDLEPWRMKAVSYTR